MISYQTSSLVIGCYGNQVKYCYESESPMWSISFHKKYRMRNLGFFWVTKSHIIRYDCHITFNWLFIAAISSFKYFVKLQHAQRWSIKYWGVPSAFCEIGGQGRFWEQSVKMRLDVVDQFYGPTSVCIGLNLCLLMFTETSCSWKGVPVPRAIFITNFQISSEGHNKIFKYFYACLKREWSLYNKFQ